MQYIAMVYCSVGALHVTFYSEYAVNLVSALHIIDISHVTSFCLISTTEMLTALDWNFFVTYILQYMNCLWN